MGIVKHEGYARFTAKFEDASGRAIQMGIGMHVSGEAAHAFAQRTTHHCGWKVRDVALHAQQPGR